MSVAEQAVGGKVKPILSFSRLDTFNQCGEKFRLRYEEKAGLRPQGALIGGSAAHETIEKAEAGDLWLAPPELLGQLFVATFDALLAKVEKPERIRWGGRKSGTWPNGEDAEWWRQAGPVFIARYAELRRADTEAGIEVDATELELLVEVEGFILKGYIDAFMWVNPDGEKVVRDYKTGSMTPAALQLATYAWGLRERQVAGVTWGEYVMLRRKDEEKRRVQYDLTPFIPIVPRLYSDLAHSIEAGHRPIRPNAFCPGCQVIESCPWGQVLLATEE